MKTSEKLKILTRTFGAVEVIPRWKNEDPRRHGYKAQFKNCTVEGEFVAGGPYGKTKQAAINALFEDLTRPDLLNVYSANGKLKEVRVWSERQQCFKLV